ncbi:(2Fe-2S)-binding protein [Desulfoluna spongiiphila]|uniref:2Fe-2S iron-sulfur cluster binding domain-containing protein n=1 Tax=Desulfoluna spongiiphila TaxID=419481 RepID=A0A1G5FKH5_9BACT|nr:(2Fe-2S)-binding protein [Desulfoluna spongiiphila]SCY39644.1 2Fe-2S iron-sulfur cluster binding domain-containing protein [Desulfoluna spongiiphila]
MFKHDKKKRPDTVSVILDDRAVDLPARVSVAAGLLDIGEIISRTSPSSGKPCAPHCLMGVCFECLMEIDGVKRQACMTEAREGMVIRRHLDPEDKGDCP